MSSTLINVMLFSLWHPFSLYSSEGAFSQMASQFLETELSCNLWIITTRNFYGSLIFLYITNLGFTSLSVICLRSSSCFSSLDPFHPYILLSFISYNFCAVVSLSFVLTMRVEKFLYFFSDILWNLIQWKISQQPSTL